MQKIYVNKIRCKKCGDIIESFSVHDFKFCQCRSVAVDGGHAYLRRLGDRNDWEDLSHLPVMQYIDVLVDGKFEESLKDLRLHYRGSSNQRVIDIQESNKHGCAIRYKGKGNWK